MTSAPLDFHPDAVLEAQGAREWYEKRNPAAAEAFLSELDHAMEQIRSTPDRWPGHILGTRRYVLRRFPFSIVYRELGGAVQIVAVAHARRRPGYWVGR